MDLRFPFVFSEDETMWTDADVDCGLWIMIVDPLGWQRMGDGVLASPLYSMRMKQCGLLSSALQDGRGWVMDLHFLFVFSEDEMM